MTSIWTNLVAIHSGNSLSAKILMFFYKAINKEYNRTVFGSNIITKDKALTVSRSEII